MYFHFTIVVLGRIVTWRSYNTVTLQQGRSDGGGYIGIYIHPQNQ